MTTARRICLIDDDTFARNALTLALEDAGYQVVSAPGAAAGFDAVRRNGADAIVTDMNMPGTDGAELITQARAAWPKMPIVAISGSDRSDVVVSAVRRAPRERLERITLDVQSDGHTVTIEANKRRDESRHDRENVVDTDLTIEVPRVAHAELRSSIEGESSETVRRRVVMARSRQLARAGKPNAWLGNRETERDCALDDRLHALLDRAVERLGLSARGYHRVLRVSRTIADLDGSTRIGAAHLAEAIQYRRL